MLFIYIYLRLNWYTIKFITLLDKPASLFTSCFLLKVIFKLQSSRPGVITDSFLLLPTPRMHAHPHKLTLDPIRQPLRWCSAHFPSYSLCLSILITTLQPDPHTSLISHHTKQETGKYSGYKWQSAKGQIQAWCPCMPGIQGQFSEAVNCGSVEGPKKNNLSGTQPQGHHDAKPEK